MCISKLLMCLQLHCTVPVYSSCPTAIAIHPVTSNLVMVHADQQVNTPAATTERFSQFPLYSYRACCPLCVCCRSLSSLWWARSTLSGAGSCRSRACTLCGWNETHLSPTSPSIPETRLTSSCMTHSCSASSTRVWYVIVFAHSLRKQFNSVYLYSVMSQYHFLIAQQQ